MKLKRIIFLIISMIMLSGCSAEYELNFVDGKYNEKFKTIGSINDENYRNEIDVLNDKNYLFVDSTLQTGDFPAESFLDEYAIYDKNVFNNDNGYGVILSYSYNSKDDYLKSSIIYSMFQGFNITDDEIYLYDPLNVFLTYPLLDDITISFKSDKKVYDNNADEIKNNMYYWYMNKDNYKDKCIRISFKKNEMLSQKNIVISDKSFKFGIYIFLIILLIGVLVIFEKVKKSNK